ncbi:Glutamine amidotransferase [Aromatoleum bremense]|uniref:Class II glutamine amidotransferase n=1 Tax=Aromatoleum bremense TaxID=76115 RepID=A0ABX1NYL0_9RHOO|nr:class II glutamine amidotransferase [Aromatoleum bremense]NMG16878.1 hypothetical protein [Aromatoleum bremense]QTQ33284.1 Glutamine amidotransferase [Aromatoleum bremense]
MCELLGMSSCRPATVSLSLMRLAEHGGFSGPHRDGWGIGYYEDGDVRLIKEAEAAADSAWVRFLESHEVAGARRKGSRGGPGVAPDPLSGVIRPNTARSGPLADPLRDALGDGVDAPVAGLVDQAGYRLGAVAGAADQDDRLVLAGDPREGGEPRVDVEDLVLAVAGLLEPW